MRSSKECVVGVRSHGTQIGATYPCPLRGGPNTAVFSAGYPRSPAGGWRRFVLKQAEAGPRPGLPTLILLAGDVETNPGPIYICDLCTNHITNRQTSILCNSTPPHWIHKNCTNTTLAQYRGNPHWTCHFTQSVPRQPHNLHPAPNYKPKLQ